jgi:hypothetical protein
MSTMETSQGDPNYSAWETAFVKHFGYRPTHEDAWQAGRDFRRDREVDRLRTMFLQNAEKIADGFHTRRVGV